MKVWQKNARKNISIFESEPRSSSCSCRRRRKSVPGRREKKWRQDAGPDHDAHRRKE